MYQAGVIKPLGVSSLKQLVDIFTKSLGTTKFRSLIMQLGIKNMYALPACRGVIIEG